MLHATKGRPERAAKVRFLFTENVGWISDEKEHARCIRRGELCHERRQRFDLPEKTQQKDMQDTYVDGFCVVQ